MMNEERMEICDNIFKFIMDELTEWIDDEIFNKTTMDQLGELYYHYILNTVNRATEELLNVVIQAISTGFEYKKKNDYYCSLCKILHIRELPVKKIANVQREYEKIFVQKYNLVFGKYQSEIESLNNKLFEVKRASDRIKNAMPNYSFMRDISTDENKLYDLNSECNSLRTRKEMIEFAMSYVQSKLAEFCNIQDPESVSKAIKREALKLSIRETYKVEDIFSSYEDFIEMLEDDIDRPYSLFFKIKLYVIIDKARKKYHSFSYTKSADEALDVCKNYLSQIPAINDLYSGKCGSPSLYNDLLGKLIENYGLIEELTTQLSSSVCLRDRRYILNKAVELYKQGEFCVFNNILPIQIEGMFADYLRDTTTFSRFTKIGIYDDAVLKDKIRILSDIKSDIYPEAVEYFMYYFNNMVRNKVAHGRYIGDSNDEINDEIFAKELILDMSMLVHMLSRRSETEKMYRFIHGYRKYYEKIIHTEDHPCFGALFNDLIGSKVISDFDSIEEYRPIQVVYWLVNPYYEKIYNQVGDVQELLDLRNQLLSEEFWEYVMEKLSNIIATGHDYLNINNEFLSIVKGLFKCNITTEVKQSLGKVNSALSKIQKMNIE